MSVFYSPWMRLLEPAAAVYGALASCRRRRLVARAQRLDAPVISVGNITVGGTGKTPVVELVIRELLRRGRRPAVLSRGYKKSAASGVNDEYLVLEQNLPGLLHLQNPDRLEAGRQALRRGADAIVLDDGFQHARLRRDLDIVLLDALNPFGWGRVLPAGLLREPIEALGAAHLFILTRCRHTHTHKLRILRQYLRRRFPGIPQAEVDFAPQAWQAVAPPGQSEPIEGWRGRRVLALAGIGNPEGFRREAVSQGLEVLEWRPFPDHHAYTASDLASLREAALSARAEGVVMTQKDAVKIAPLLGTPPEIPWCYLRIEPKLEAGEAVFQALLDGALKKKN